jgi:maleylpyruvate isomerase
MQLHGYFRSSASWRVRIGLALKGVAFETVPHDLRTGAQRAPDYVALNPQGYVPALVLAGGTILTQSLAILEWLEETRAEPPFLPQDKIERARVRAAALVIAADTHPLQNLKIRKRLEALGGAELARDWCHDMIAEGLAPFEALIAGNAGPFCFGAAPGLADILLVPMLANARLFGVDVAAYPRALAAARPENQPDAS